MFTAKNVFSTNRSRGFGDTIAKITNAFGIPTCGGCERRKQTLNRLFPYKNNPPQIRISQSSSHDEATAKRVLESQLMGYPQNMVDRSYLILGDSSQRPVIESGDRFSSAFIPQRYGEPAVMPRFGGRLADYNNYLEIFASTDRDRRGPDARSGPLDWEGSRRNARDDAKQAPATGTPAGTPFSFACGVDVTDLMKDAVAKTKRIFGLWNDDKKHESCKALHSISAGDIAWDIIELHAQVTSDVLNKPFRPFCATSGATPACGSSVTVENTCHFAGSANYVIWGIMCRLCHGYYARKLSQLSWYERIDKATYEYGLWNFSRTGMLRLIDLYKKYVPLLMLEGNAKNIEGAKRWSIAGYEGWPTARNTPVPDRANCTVTCPHSPSQSKFKISWYPHLNPYRRRLSLD